MHLPILNPNLVLWFTLVSCISNIVINAIMTYNYRALIKKVLEKIKL